MIFFLALQNENDPESYLDCLVHDDLYCVTPFLFPSKQSPSNATFGSVLSPAIIFLRYTMRV